jgi:signal transduction histidine kinase
MQPAVADHLVMALSNFEVEGRRGAQVLELPREDHGIEAERERIKSHIARELHDQFAQTLINLSLQTEVFIREQHGHQQVLDHLSFVQSSVREALNNLRQLLCDLRGTPGLAKGLVQALGEGVLATCQLRMKMKASLWVSGSWPGLLPPETSIHIYRIIEEAINNAYKHGGATRVEVALKASDARLVVKVRDDGRGIAWLDMKKPIGMGILGMRERAALSGGVISIRSRSMAGTTVTLSIPREALRWSPKHVLHES